METRANLDGWAEYASDPNARFQLMRSKRTRHARYFDRVSGCWFGPEQSNVAPAVAWGLLVGIEHVFTKSTRLIAA